MEGWYHTECLHRGTDWRQSWKLQFSLISHVICLGQVQQGLECDLKESVGVVSGPHRQELLSCVPSDGKGACRGVLWVGSLCSRFWVRFLYASKCTFLTNLGRGLFSHLYSVSKQKLRYFFKIRKREHRRCNYGHKATLHRWVKLNPHRELWVSGHILTQHSMLGRE